MQTLLIPVDGSEYSNRAVEYAVQRANTSRYEVQLHLLNVQVPIVTVNVKLFISEETLKAYYREEGDRALASALVRLANIKLAAKSHIGIGDPGKIICDYATEISATEIVIGTHGRGFISGALIGSVAQKVVHRSSIPIVLVK